jgi:hypothetical protein
MLKGRAMIPRMPTTNCANTGANREKPECAPWRGREVSAEGATNPLSKEKGDPGFLAHPWPPLSTDTRISVGFEPPGPGFR